MRKRLLCCGVALGVLAAGGAGAEQNPLLGKWRLLNGDAGCYTQLQFTPTTQKR